MSYHGAATAAESRTLLSGALEALQQEPNLPEDVLNVAQNIAQAIGALFEAERASSDVDGKASVRHAMGSLSQTMALMQELAGPHPGVEATTRALAQVMSKLYPLSNTASMRPSMRNSMGPGAQPVRVPSAAPVPPEARSIRPAPSEPSGPREQLEANVGATTESNFFVGFSGDISEGGVFVATYLTLPLGARCEVLVTLPGGFEQRLPGTVRFVRDPMDMESEPGIGVGFDSLTSEARELILRFIRKRAPLFYDD